MTGMCKFILPYFFLECFFFWELGYPSQIESGRSTLRGQLGAIFSLVCVCGPFEAWEA
jgi:hypothetical protein